jgi:hypothetical protein
MPLLTGTLPVSTVAALATIDQVLERMDHLLDRWEAARDNRAVFLLSYRIVTQVMEDAVRRGRFEDNEWMERLDVQFAQEFFDAVDADESGKPFPECWRVAFDLARKRKTTVLRDLLLGMNAHIVHDLPLALVKVGIEPAKRGLRNRDHQKVNEILIGLVDRIQDEVTGRYSWMLRTLDRWVGTHDEILTRAGLLNARTAAWIAAVALFDSPPEARRRIALDLDHTARTIALGIASSGRFLSPVLRFLRPIDARLARWASSPKDRMTDA